MAKKLCIFSLILIYSLQTGQDLRATLIVWNVGQGQWVTLVENSTCWHFDTGGERAPWSALLQTCGRLDNRIFFSHWDLDHISFAATLHAKIPNSCVVRRPVGSPSLRKQKLMSKIPLCVNRDLPGGLTSFIDTKARTPNEMSRVILWQHILLPGDSTSSEEKKWVASFPELKLTRWLILGHHGSQTSTSELLLNHLPNALVAVSSARRAKYGHPHLRVQQSLRAHHIPLLRTEEWGNIYFEL